MTLLVIGALFGLAYTYIGYPLLIWLLARLFPRPWTRGAIFPTVSIVLAVHNGEKLLRKKINQLLAVEYPNLREIIIVSDGSTDRTNSIIMTRHSPLIHPILLPEHRGKAVALNAGLARATSELVLFVDVRPEIEPGTIKQIVSNFDDPTVGCVASDLSLRHDGHDSTTRAVGDLYWRYEQWIRKCESTLDSTLGVYGGFYCVRRSLAARQPDGMILDDMFQPLSIVRQGYRAVIDSQTHVYDSWPKNSKDEFKRKVRTLAGNYQLVRLLPWCIDIRNWTAFQFISHKVMRLLCPYLLILLFVSSAACSFSSPIYAAFSVLQAGAYVAALTGIVHRSWLGPLGRLVSPFSAFILLNTAAVVALYRYLTKGKDLWKIWDPTPRGVNSTAFVSSHGRINSSFR
jgi:cellulose synthase/poly-beta-1,6-N-acetylglucosamine synthase-like glycosyltransferase